ncbi:hypothetical protein BaRGS_00028092 [Batillaria attramentaria]|uniref:Uncharacterized protein n=1 Tax=Batillaria attramentaria TaxID=370345 RepID=A0ABD0JZS4_9CAEN
MDNAADERADVHATASTHNSDVSNKQPQPQPSIDQESTQDTEHPQSPLYSDMVASRLLHVEVVAMTRGPVFACQGHVTHQGLPTDLLHVYSHSPCH